MDETIVETFNKYLDEDSILYHLGDFAFGLNNIYELRGKLKIKELILILGNHDKDIRKNKNGIQGLFTSVQDVLNIKIDKNSFFLSHYAHLIWNQNHKGRYHLFAHSHNRLKSPMPRSMDVGIDVAYAKYGEYRPFHIDEIVEMLSKQELKIVDGHK